MIINYDSIILESLYDKEFFFDILDNYLKYCDNPHNVLYCEIVKHAILHGTSNFSIDFD